MTGPLTLNGLQAVCDRRGCSELRLGRQRRGWWVEGYARARGRRAHVVATGRGTSLSEAAAELVRELELRAWEVV